MINNSPKYIEQNHTPNICQYSMCIIHLHIFHDRHVYFTLCIFEFLWTCICLYISVLLKLIFITFIDLLLRQKLALFNGWTE